MKVELLQWIAPAGWSAAGILNQAQLVIYFGEREALHASACYASLRSLYPNAHIVGCSTGGEIFGAEVFDKSISVSAIYFEHTHLKPASSAIESAADSLAAGRSLAQQLNQPDLSYVMVLSDGTNVNGSDLIRGLYEILDDTVIITGGLAGDGANFQHTTVGLNAEPVAKQIVAIGFYGDSLQVGYGSVGGWRTFGPTWKITRSDSNVLYELDGKPALELYKIYLGDAAQQLPKNALLYPFNMRAEVDSEHDIVRTIVGVDEDAKSLIFAGDVPEGSFMRLMRGEFGQLIEGAADAATLAKQHVPANDSLALLVSCIGRKLLLNTSIHHETRAIADIFNHAVPTIGFYSYGEICHQEFSGKCGLHNQTMTVTTLFESPPLAPVTNLLKPV
jgi:hypothetical protein